MTPVKLHVVAYFTKHLQAQQKPKSRDNRKVKPTVYGEVLTRDEIIERVEPQAKEKAEKAAEKAKKAAERAQKAAKQPKKVMKKGRGENQEESRARSDEEEEIGKHDITI